MSNTTIDSCLENSVEVQLSLFRWNLYRRRGGATNPETLFNLQKRFEINESCRLGVGTPFKGMLPSHLCPTWFSALHYGNNQFHWRGVEKVFGGE